MVLDAGSEPADRLPNSSLHDVRGFIVTTREDVFGCSLTCGDGRGQGPSRKWQKIKRHVDFVDKITVAGLVRRLAERDTLTLEFVMRELRTYLTKHKSKIVTISAHEDCAGNRTCKKRQVQQLRIAWRIISNMIKSFKLGWEVEVVILWISKINGRWMPRKIGNKPAIQLSA